jgi:hypothetical protein
MAPPACSGPSGHPYKTFREVWQPFFKRIPTRRRQDGEVDVAGDGFGGTTQI